MLLGGIVVANEGKANGFEDPSPAPFAWFYRFMTRKRPDEVVLAPEEAVDQVQLMKMSTSYASRYVLKEKELGTLEPGKFADFVVLSKDYFTILQAQILTVISLMVVMGGKTRVLWEELAKDLGLPAVGPQLKFSFEIPKREDRADFDATQMTGE